MLKLTKKSTLGLLLALISFGQAYSAEGYLEPEWMQAVIVRITAAQERLTDAARQVRATAEIIIDSPWAGPAVQALLVDWVAADYSIASIRATLAQEGLAPIARAALGDNIDSEEVGNFLFALRNFTMVDQETTYYNIKAVALAKWAEAHGPLREMYREFACIPGIGDPTGNLEYLAQEDPDIDLACQEFVAADTRHFNVVFF